MLFLGANGGGSRAQIKEVRDIPSAAVRKQRSNMVKSPRIQTMRQTIRTLRMLLLKHWDPLDVGDNPNLSDEYDSYLWEIMKLISISPTHDKLCAKLELVEQQLGVGVSKQRREEAVNIILERLK
jgi:hypothetical protein